MCLCASAALCRVDASKLEGSSLHIKKLRHEASNCQMKINSVSKDEMTVASSAELWFQDCRSADVQVTASRTIGKPADAVLFVFQCTCSSKLSLEPDKSQIMMLPGSLRTVRECFLTLEDFL